MQVDFQIGSHCFPSICSSKRCALVMFLSNNLSELMCTEQNRNGLVGSKTLHTLVFRLVRLKLCANLCQKLLLVVPMLFILPIPALCGLTTVIWWSARLSKRYGYAGACNEERGTCWTKYPETVLWRYQSSISFHWWIKHRIYSQKRFDERI